MMSACRVLLFAFLLCPAAIPAAEIRVAVAANFAPTLQRLAGEFTALSGHRVVVSSASSGKHYAQIRNGAAFDVFLSADSARPERLEREGVGVPGSRFVYAEGRLALWMPRYMAVTDARAALTAPGITHVAIANPRLAPYGVAAQQVLNAWGLWEALGSHLVRGENIAQAFQFVATGNAEAGLVALSQLRALNDVPQDAYAIIPASLHAPIAQQAILLRQGSAAEALLAFLRSERALGLIRAAGYALPGDA